METMKMRNHGRRDMLKLMIAVPATQWLSAFGAEAGSPHISRLEVFNIRSKGKKGGKTYFELATEGGVKGLAGPLMDDQSQALTKLLPDLNKFLVGKDPRQAELCFGWMWAQLYPDKPLSKYAEGIDPLTCEAIWNTRRKNRHTPTGLVICALSAVDNALWDVRGKLAGKPVYQLLGGTREKIGAYLSIDLKLDVKKARKLFDMGHTCQKWFFRDGPPQGEEGFARVVGLVEGLRSELGDKATLMFDFQVGSRGRSDWDVPYAIRVAKAIAPFKPKWLEEPFSPEEIESYRKLKGETDIPLAAGEHFYSRWNVKPFLDAKILSYVQTDPEWCGGISEMLEISKLVSGHEGVQLIPHGHQALAAAQFVASQPESRCPMVEHGLWLSDLQSAQTRDVKPEGNFQTVPTEPGLGPGIDWGRYTKV
jgi:L-rhamnonate dehydratase